MRTALALGGANCLHRDLIEYLTDHGNPDGVVACNEAGAEWPGELNAWVSLHPRYFEQKGWVAKREANGYPPCRRYFGHVGAKLDGATVEPVGYMLPGQEKTASSGIFAAKVALIDLGFDRVVLCGVPMDERPHFHGADNWTKGTRARDFRVQLEKVDSDVLARMRSMSGWTRDFLGGPDGR